MWDNLLESLILLVVGMGGVFAALLLLAGMIWLLRWADEWLNQRRILAYAQKVETHAVDTDLNDEVIAVLAAAASSTLKKRVTVRRVRFLSPRSGSTWASSGRLNIMASHLIQRKGGA